MQGLKELFSSEEKNLLFETLSHCLGKDNVYCVSKEEANRNPRRYEVAVTRYSYDGRHAY